VKVVKTKPAEMTGDWYDEYAAERKTKRVSDEDRALMRNPVQCVKVARQALVGKDYERAYDLANAALKQNPEMAEAFFVRGAGVYYSAFGEEKEAVKDLEKARKLGYKTAELFEVLGKLYDARREYDKAIEAVSYGIENCPDKELWRCRAALYQTVGKKEQALEDLNVYVGYVPDKAMGYHLRANVLQLMGRNEEALEDLAACVKHNPNNTHAMTSRATLLAQMGRNQEALDQISKVMATDQYDDDAFRLRGDIYFNLKQYDRAVTDYSKAIKMSPEYARAGYEARSRAYEKLGKLDLAKQDKLEASKIADKPAEKPVYDFKEND